MTAMTSNGQSGGRRVALVIGNSAYRLGAPLANPKSDAAAIAEALKRLDFDPVEQHLDLDKPGHDRALKQFAALSKKADIAVVYYAGHGMELDGENYLLPVDCELADTSSLAFETTRLSDLMRAVDGADRFRFVILDACRDNPFYRQMEGIEATRSIHARGLAAPPDYRGNTLVAYAARHGTQAKDGHKGANSPFAAALLKHIETPNTDIRLVIGRIRDDVRAATGNVQEPAFYGSMGGNEIQLKYVADQAASRPSEESTALLKALEEERDWEKAQRADTMEALHEFLSAHPNGRFADQAKAKLGEKSDDIAAAAEKEDWIVASRSGLSIDLREFKSKWPGGHYAEEAERRLAETLNREESYEFTLIEKAMASLSASEPSPDPSPLRAFLARYPKSEKAAVARDLLSKLDDTHIARLNLVASKDAAQLYLNRFPEGRHVADANAFLAGAGDDRAWIRYLSARKRKDKDEALTQYVKDWPDGRHSVEALRLTRKFPGWRTVLKRLILVVAAILLLVAILRALGGQG